MKSVGWRKTILPYRQNTKRDTKEQIYNKNSDSENSNTTRSSHENVKEQGWIRTSGLRYTQKSVSVIENPEGYLFPSFRIYTEISLSLDAQEGPDGQHRVLYSTFCSSLYGNRIQKRTDMLSVCVISESGGCNLKTSTKLQSDPTPRQHRQETKEKEQKSSAWFTPHDLPELGCSPIPGAWAGLSLMSGLG